MSSRVKRVENRPLKLHTLAVNRDLTLHLRRPGRLAGSRRARESKNLLAGGGQEKGGEGTEGWRVSSGRAERVEEGGCLPSGHIARKPSAWRTVPPFFVYFFTQLSLGGGWITWTN